MMVSGWFQFMLYALSEIVTTIFSLDTGLGFSMGDIQVALILIGIVATAFIIRTGSAVSSEVSAAHGSSLRNSAREARAAQNEKLDRILNK